MRSGLRPATLAGASRVDRTLRADALRDIAEGMAAARHLWRSVVRHDPGDRHPVRLLGADSYEVWIIGWCAGQGVPTHDHGASAGALAVVEGGLVEARLGEPDRALAAGTTVDLPLGLIHAVHHDGDVPATSIHVYSPPLREMTHYDPDTVATTHVEQVDEPAVLEVPPAPSSIPARPPHPADLTLPRRTP